MRIILYTGKGGVGKTTVAAATALAAAQRGQRTLVVSTDRAHSLGDAFTTRLGPEPTEIAPHLDALEVDEHWELKQHWGEIQDYLRTLFTAMGAQSLVAEEVAVPPGFEELSGLLRLQQLVDTGGYEVIIVDCAPTGSTLRLLSLPEVAEWYMRRVFKLERTAMRAMKPIMDRLLPVPLPSDRVYASIEVLYGRLQKIQSLLAQPEVTTLRLVTLAEKMSIEETRRAYAQLSVFDLSVDAVVVNRLYPADSEDPFTRTIYQQQQSRLQEIRESFAPLPLLEVGHLGGEALGPELLSRLAQQVFAQTDPTAVLIRRKPIRIEERAGLVVMCLDLWFAEKAELSLLQRHNELIIQVGGTRRCFLLPRLLAGREAQHAEVRGETLEIEFGGES
jgi:arsenite-transporting ATPase